MKTCAVLVVVAGAIAGCHQPEVVHSVDWYRANTSERQAKAAECTQNPGELGNTPNCVNAAKAAWLEDSHGRAPSLGKPVTRIKSIDEILKEHSKKDGSQ